MASKRIIFAGIFIVTGILAYAAYKDVNKFLPANNSREVAVGFRVSGRIAKMPFAERAEVKQGDVLASLDSEPFEEALTYAKAQLEVARVEYNKSVHLPARNFAAIEAARAEVETAQHTYDAAHEELIKRRGTLVAGQLDNVYNDDVQNEQDADLSLEKARRELAQQENIEGNDTKIMVDKAAIQVAEANVAIAQTNLNDTQLLAPVDGIITRRISEIGVSVPAGAPVYALMAITKTASNQ